MKTSPIRLLLHVFICLLPCGAAAQTDVLYRIIKIRGNISIAASGKKLQCDTKFKTSDKLVFSAATDALVVADEKSGTFLITPEASLRKYRLKALAISLDTRPGNILADPQLREFLLQNDSLLLLNGRFSLLLGNKAFPMDSTHLFYLQYTWDNQEINKILPSSGDTLFIRTDSLFRVDNAPIDPGSISSPFYLFYFNTETRQSIAFPDLVVPLFLIQESEQQLRAEIERLFDTLQLSDPEQQFLAANNYLTLLYGRPGEIDLWHWLHP
jgi:hypothetical protein